MEIIGFELGANMADCPKCWYNFICDQQNKYNFYRDVSVARIRSGLKPYGGRYHFRGSRKHPTIEFETEQGYTMFLLKYS